jgi:amidophosphoribosyltransferase
MKRLVAALRHYGAKEIHLRSTAPPLRHPCYFGIDIPQEVELIAAGRSVQEIADYIGVDSLGYLSIAGLGRAITSTENNTFDDETAAASLHTEFCYGCMEKKGWPFDPVGAAYSARSAPQLIVPTRRETVMRRMK